MVPGVLSAETVPSISEPIKPGTATTVDGERLGAVPAKVRRSRSALGHRLDSGIKSLFKRVYFRRDQFLKVDSH